MESGTTRAAVRPEPEEGTDPKASRMTGDRRRGTGKRHHGVVQLPSPVLGLPSAVRGHLRRAARALRAIMALSWALTPIGLDAFAPAIGSAGHKLAASSGSHLDPSQPSPSPTPPPPDGPPPVEDPLLLPDLMTSNPAGLQILSLRTGRVLRFTNVVWNGGEGPLELFGVPDVAAASIRVTQRAYTAGGVVAEWTVGEFIFHPTHEHWHLDGFVVYELWSVDPRGDLDQLMASSGKLSYCLIDTDVVDRASPLRPSARQYYGCGRARQGLSVGWGDTYLSYLDGQSLPLDGVPDGFYALASTANANARLREAKISNNAGMVYLQIYGNRLNVIPQADLAWVRWLTEH